MTIKIELAQPVAKKLKILFYGPSGSHKTLSSLTFPRALMVDAESGTDLYVGAAGIAPFHRPDHPVKTLSELQEVINIVRADNGKTWDTLIIDPVTVFYDVEKNVASANNSKDMDFRSWAKINNRMGSLYNMLTGLNVHVILIARESIEYEGQGNNLRKVGVKPDADKKLVYSMDFVLHFNANHSAQVEKSRGVVLGKEGLLPTVSWADFEPVAQLYVAGQPQHYVDDEEAAALEADNLANDDVRKEFYAAWVKQGLTQADTLTALGCTERLGEWTQGRAKADEQIKAWVAQQLTAKPAAPKAPVITSIQCALQYLAVGDVLDHSTSARPCHETITTITDMEQGKRIATLRSGGQTRTLELTNVALHKLVGGSKLLAAQADATRAPKSPIGHNVWVGEKAIAS